MQKLLVCVVSFEYILIIIWEHALAPTDNITIRSPIVIHR